MSLYKGEALIAGVEGIVVDSELSTTSVHPVQNKTITEKINKIEEKVTNTEEVLSQPITNATTLTGEGTTMSTVDNVARVDMVGGKTVVSDAQLINVTPTSVETSTGSSLSLEALTSKYFPTGMKSAGTVYDELNFTEMKAIQRIGTDGTALAEPIITPITESIDPILDTVDGGTLTINVDNPVSGVPYKITEGYEYPIWRLVRQG